MIEKIFPFIGWLQNYNFKTFRVDLVSGLTVALVLIPQSMAYAQLAGLSPWYGLYASFLPPMVASLFGSSRQLATGPVAVVSLMTAAVLEPMATAGSEMYIGYAILLALIVGIFQFCLGILKLGLVVNFLSHPVVNGFTNAAAIIIASSQLSKLFGVYVDKGEHHYETIIRVIQAAFHYTHWATLFMGTLAFAIMYGLKRLSPRIPNVLVAVVITTLLSWSMNFEHNRQVKLSAIDSPELHESINEFNACIKEIPKLSEKRTELFQRLDQINKTNDHLAILTAEHEIEVLSFHIESLKQEGHIFRTRIRDMLMEGVEGSNGEFNLYPIGGIQGRGESDGRLWRIKIDNNPVDPDKLIVTGGGAVVGVVPQGIPSISIPKIDFSVILKLLPYAAIISLLGFMEAISIAKAMAAKTGQRLDPNQELIGQGLANIIGSLAKSYPTSGSFSRSAVNLQSGAITGFSSVFTSLTVVIALLFFTPLLYHLPQSVLAAVIMMAVIGLINVSGFIHAWKAQWYDGTISIISFVGTLAFAPHLDRGIMIGVALSILVFLYKSMRPSVASLSRHDNNALRDSIIHSLMRCRYIDLIRFEGSLFFANASYLEDKIASRMKEREDLKHFIIASNGINDIDASGEEALSLIIENVRSAGIDISFSGVNETVMSVFKRTHLLEKIGEDHIYPTMEAALTSVHPTAHTGGHEQECPLTKVCKIS
ncbi:MAG: SulP family inorganic anion transporter [Planctomycetota bacterium]